MKVQNYANHVRYYAPHHFVLLPASLLAVVFCTWKSFGDTEQGALWGALAFIALLVLSLAIMLRQHYALTNQNRVIRLELRFRYYVLTHERLELLEDRLSLGQLFALRFASDAELPGLVQRTLAENLSPDAIKRAIQHWHPDHMRV